MAYVKHEIKQIVASMISNELSDIREVLKEIRDLTKQDIRKLQRENKRLKEKIKLLEQDDG
jgi:gas vesicle protein